MTEKLALGLDFGTEAIRAVLVDLHGREHGVGVVKYPHGQILNSLPGSTTKLPPQHAYQHPSDWLESAAKATKLALKKASAPATAIIGIGVDFTSCTMLPTMRDGTPLCLDARYAKEPQAWPKLWKHHGAAHQAERMTTVAQRRDEPFLSRYGGTIGLEWIFPKILETLETAPAIYQAAEVWLEAGDWFVWQLVGGPANTLSRSTCQAGYKGLWSAEDGFPSEDYFAAVHPKFSKVVTDKMPGRLVPPGLAAGQLTAAMAKRFGLSAGTPVSAAIIDAHAGVPGAGAAEPGTLVLVMGTSSCHMLNSELMHAIPGIAGVVKDGILPGFYGYETGQAAVGDAFDWLRRLTGKPDFKTLATDALKIPPGSDGVLCLDWFNGCRTPLMDASVKGAFTGLAMHHGPAHLYRAMMEASACGLRWIIENLRAGGVPVKHLIATGGLPHHNPQVVQIYADVLGKTITVHPSKQGPALGAAVLGALAASAFKSPRAAIRAMTTPPQGHSTIYKPDRKSKAAYDRLYSEYRQLAEFIQKKS
jgi:L-ribulokinase